IIHESIFQEFRPISSIGEQGPVDIVVKGTPEHYLDLANSYLLVQAKITKSDGSKLADDAPVGIVNYPLHSMFSQVDVTLGDKVMSSPHYPHRAYLETLL
uniref:hypothetical protein n=1 Tax=Acinetobacter baumannii TaxID=470 RepID=UPI001C07A7C0